MVECSAEKLRRVPEILSFFFHEMLSDNRISCVFRERQLDCMVVVVPPPPRTPTALLPVSSFSLCKRVAVEGSRETAWGMTRDDVSVRSLCSQRQRCGRRAEKTDNYAYSSTACTRRFLRIRVTAAVLVDFEAGSAHLIES